MLADMRDVGIENIALIDRLLLICIFVIKIEFIIELLPFGFDVSLFWQ
jgi:hypothetical protein